MQLDSTDKKLINLLQNDSKQTTKRLSLQLNLSVTAVYERIKKLEKENVIDKYVAIVNKNKIEKSFLVFCHLKLIQHSREYVTTFEREILKLEEVSECFHVSGDFDYILKIYVKDMEEYRNFMVSKLTAIKYIGSTHSIFAIEQVKNTTVINL
ncbi:Lrp/AsnC family transcriptional regulator [uncultured Polaribacter sp.]|uniref:Lrp/AsnC family transcriptional regulator n=1 Tax=uncultured Polaribacter sp. TaxID=174711 RepID=UPI002768445C|nr:Lrp/AsnC family transcriptional regulator [Polaribacter sp.]|tara:strand:+ start:513 stop:971 length:459 start_codon:yes stop_codon:yes gene_type:complete